MEYSIQELSRLSGVTTRTLRWYDKIGLLKPSRVSESGYRYYGSAQVDRLQDILYYRALGVELAQIKQCLDEPSFDRLSALRSHLTALQAEQTQLNAVKPYAFLRYPYPVVHGFFKHIALMELTQFLFLAIPCETSHSAAACWLSNDRKTAPVCRSIILTAFWHFWTDAILLF